MSLRTFTPLGWAIGAAVILAVLVAFALFNPWSGFLRGQVADARADEETAIDARAGLEQAAKAQAQVETAATEVRVIVEQARGAVHAVELEARAAPGGDTPLADASADRLRQSDDILCGLREGVCARRPDGPAAGTDDPG